MADKIWLEVVTPEKIVVSEDCQTAVAPGSEGEFGVLPGHTPFLTTLKVGGLRYKDAAGTERCVFINSGFAEVLPDKVIVLAESAERRCDIDVDRARQALDRAKRRMEIKEEDVDFERVHGALMRAQARVSLAETRARAGMQ
ncbi:MAG: F0F1 ATP synthase subunit epsilon [Desulfatibacillaceae bacterium]